MVRDLEEIQPRQSLGEQARVDVLLDVAREQEPSGPDRPEQHDRYVVDPRPRIGRFQRDLAADGPEHSHRDLVDRQPIPGGDRRPSRGAGLPEAIDPCRVARSGSAHPGLEDARDVIPRQQERQPGDVILVGVRQDDRIEPPVPWRDPSVELDEESVRIRPSIDQQATAARAFDQDRIALADVEHGDAGDSRRPGDRDRAGDGDRDDETAGREAGRG